MVIIVRNLVSIAFMFAVNSVTLHAEPSVYGNNTTTYRQSSSSKRVISAMKLKIAQQDERIDGLTTIIEGLSASLNELQMRNIGSTSVEIRPSDDGLLKKLAEMIDEINENYVSKEELRSALLLESADRSSSLLT